jgi:hypothetical protein
LVTVLEQPWDVERLRPLVERWDERVRRDVSRFDRLVAESRDRGSVLREPASEEEIAAAESRLGVRFPPSYRSFLAISNGANASSSGADKEPGNAEGFVRVDELQFMASAAPWTVEAWTSGTVDMHERHECGDHFVDIGDFRPLGEGLLINRPASTSYDILVPRKGRTEWEFWLLEHSDAGAIGSFADFLRWAVGLPDLRPKPADADEL